MTDTKSNPVGTAVDADILRSSEAERTAIEDWNAQRRCLAVREITDQSLLSRLALEDWSPDVREAAARKLTDPDVLWGIYQHDSSFDVRLGAHWRFIQLPHHAASPLPSNTASTARRAESTI